MDAEVAVGWRDNSHVVLSHSEYLHVYEMVTSCPGVAVEHIDSRATTRRALSESPVSPDLAADGRGSAEKYL